MIENRLILFGKPIQKGSKKDQQTSKKYRKLMDSIRETNPKMIKTKHRIICKNEAMRVRVESREVTIFAKKRP